LTKKTEVLRLTKSEVNVINLIREVGVEKLYTELDNITTSDSNCLKSFKDALLNKPCFTIEQLIEKGVLTQKDATRLLQAYTNKENILIAGETGSGKTTLLNAMIKEDTNDKTYTLLLEESKDIDLNRVAKRTNIESVTTEAQDSNLVLSHILAKTVDRLILADVTSLNTTINLLMALTY
jgi:ABC-type molybdenum transport system ATPase subunit/photorepair protein PhrA